VISIAPVRFLLPAAIVFFAMVAVFAGNWPNFRGPTFDGSNTETGLPIEISKTDHLVWNTELVGLGSSTPAVWGKSVFITSLNTDQTGVVAIKINLQSGKIEWQKEFSSAERNDRRSDMAGPSPTTDGTNAIFISGAGDLVCYGFDGSEKWKKNLQKDYGKFSLKWTYSSSPMLYEGTLYIQVLQRNNPSYLLALDPKSGKEKWKHIRECKAVSESQEAYSSPIPISHDGRKEIVVAGADCITGHSLKDGEERWRWETWNSKRITDLRVVPCPVYGDEMIVAGAPKGRPIYSLFAGSGEGVNPGVLKWKSHRVQVSCDVTTPLYHNGYFYILNGRKKVLSCVDPYSGRIEWSHAIPAMAKIEASPTAADGKIYFMSQTGEFFVYRASPRYELLHSCVLGQDPEATNRATVVPAQGRLLIRLGKELWCMD